jgi:hypothetical protein
MWIVMTSSAKMPTSVKSPYRNVAVVKLSQEYTARDLKPKMISIYARGVVRLHHLGHHHAGRTVKASAYERALAEAQRRAFELNNSQPLAEGELLASWGGSA